MTERAPIVGVAGLTHLGVNTGAALAERGFSTVWYSPDAETISLLRSGDMPVSEPGLRELVTKNASRIRVTDGVEALASCDVVYIASDVPTAEDGQSDLSDVRALIDSVASVLGRTAILVVLCQVPPGFTRRLPIPPERLYYQVETLIFGRAVERALHPERFIVGAAVPVEPLPRAFRTVLDAFGCPVLPMRYESAELAKIAINCCLVAMVSTANTLAELCEGIGADWSEIVPALRLDRRIGPYSYLTPGLGISGGNLERDLATVIRLAGETGADRGVVEAWVANSRHRKDWAFDILARDLYRAAPGARLAVLGLAYKQDTHSTKNAPSLALLSKLTDKRIAVFDPVVKGETVPFARAASDALDACEGADALAIMTPWDQFRQLDPAMIAARLRGRLVLDPYAILDDAGCARAGLDRRTLGVGHSDGRAP
jgi:UDPglucose 6-dehydrogenase